MAMLSSRKLAQSLQDDPLNTLGLRNQHNTPNTAYNCGGFALSIYNWICPYVRTDTDDDSIYDIDDFTYTDEARDDIINDCIEQGWPAKDIEEEILQRDVDFLLDQYPFLAPAHIEDCKNSETLIAYRLFIKIDEKYGCIADTDFHFKIRINGFWFEKMGCSPIRLCSLDADGPWVVPDSDTAYTSRIVYFRINRDFI